jgi:hypothetical protein
MKFLNQTQRKKITQALLKLLLKMGIKIELKIQWDLQGRRLADVVIDNYVLPSDAKSMNAVSNLIHSRRGYLVDKAFNKPLTSDESKELSQLNNLTDAFFKDHYEEAIDYLSKQLKGRAND